jgi:hypothetical protein
MIGGMETWPAAAAPINDELPAADGGSALEAAEPAIGEPCDTPPLVLVVGALHAIRQPNATD